MITKEDIQSLGWTADKIEGEYYIQGMIEGENDNTIWVLYINYETGQSTIDKEEYGHMSQEWDNDTILDCKIQNKADLRIQMDWLKIPIASKAEQYKVGDIITDGQYSIEIIKISNNYHGVVYCGKRVDWMGMACIQHSDRVQRVQRILKATADDKEKRTE